jgi:hypothetical protein
MTQSHGLSCRCELCTGTGAVRVEAPKPRRFTPAEAQAFLGSWYRVVAGDGSTIAYVPDKATADRIATLGED